MPKTYQNTYKNLPQVDFVPTLVSRDDLRAYMDTTDYSDGVKTSAMTLIRQESDMGDPTGVVRKGINNNFGGIQADGSKWKTKYEANFNGVVYKLDNTKTWRWFLCFDTWQHFVDFMLEQTKARGIYWGGFAFPHANILINSVDSFITAYYKEWVEGSLVLSKSSIYDYPDYKDLVSIYKQEYKYFSQSIQKKNQQASDLLRAAIDNSRYDIHFALFGN